MAFKLDDLFKPRRLYLVNISVKNVCSRSADPLHFDGMFLQLFPVLTSRLDVTYGLFVRILRFCFASCVL